MANKIKKTVVLDAQTKAELSKQMEILASCGKSSLSNDKRKAKALLAIKERELYKCESGCSEKSFKEWYTNNHDATIYGITYGTACTLINTFKFVWTDKALAHIPYAVASRLAPVCRKAESKQKVLELVKDGKINESTTQNAVNALLKAEGLVKPKNGSDGKSNPIESEEFLDAFAKVNTYMMKCKDTNMVDAWKVIKETITNMESKEA